MSSETSSPPLTGIREERRPSTFLRLTPDVPEGTGRRPSTFLALAPDTSPSYPQMPERRVSTDASQPAEPARRHSSVSSVPRILKLGPVHWGEHLEEHKDDFHPLSPN